MSSTGEEVNNKRKAEKEVLSVDQPQTKKRKGGDLTKDNYESEGESDNGTDEPIKVSEEEIKARRHVKAKRTRKEGTTPAATDATTTEPASFKTSLPASFTFGNLASNKDSLPDTSTATSTTESKPFTFNFGNFGNTSTPQFSFGAFASFAPKDGDATATTTTTTTTTAAAPFNFNFGTLAAKPKTDDEETEKGEEWNENYSPPRTEPTQKVEMSNEPVITGEEDEASVFSERVKVFRFEDKNWKEKGAGNIKINKHNESGKHRILMRNDGTKKVVINGSFTRATVAKIHQGNPTYVNLSGTPQNVEGLSAGDTTPHLIKFLKREAADQFIKSVTDIVNTLPESTTPETKEDNTTTATTEDNATAATATATTEDKKSE